MYSLHRSALSDKHSVLQPQRCKVSIDVRVTVLYSIVMCSYTPTIFKAAILRRWVNYRLRLSFDLFAEEPMVAYCMLADRRATCLRVIWPFDEMLDPKCAH